jgi:NAD(P)H dehydrogenase (quinone)
MNIGIIVHSQTGNTMTVSEKLRSALREKGHKVTIEKLAVIGNYEQSYESIHFESFPNLEKYDAIIFASLVQAFALSPFMKKYLTQIDSLKGKSVSCFVTEYFPYRWMGGNNAVNKMVEICTSKHATILTTAIINWSNKKRDHQIEELVSQFVKQHEII